MQNFCSAGTDPVLIKDWKFRASSTGLKQNQVQGLLRVLDLSSGSVPVQRNTADCRFWSWLSMTHRIITSGLWLEKRSRTGPFGQVRRHEWSQTVWWGTVVLVTTRRTVRALFITAHCFRVLIGCQSVSPVQHGCIQTHFHKPLVATVKRLQAKRCSLWKWNRPLDSINNF